MRHRRLEPRKKHARNYFAKLIALGMGTTIPILACSTPNAAAVTLDVWERVAACESSGNWNINTGNGYYGGLQFLPSTWAEFGGLAFASYAHQATKEQQIEVAERVLAKQGPKAWPHCSVVAGLSREGAISSGTPASTNVDRDSKSSRSESFPGSENTATTQSSPRLPVSDAIVSTKYRQAGSWAAGFHTGIDFAVPIGTSVHAVDRGTVISANWAGAYGNSIVLQHPDGMYTLYAHLSSLSVRPGQGVSAGQEIGLSGSTGNSTGPHLHFESRTHNDYGSHTDPVAYLRSLGIAV
ncbi:transglycosylase family protein [Streptomyces sp. TX20-6-3]|nr:transglycosylase family protein [Streptomyces sp. TX20-6-3]